MYHTYIQLKNFRQTKISPNLAFRVLPSISIMLARIGKSLHTLPMAPYIPHHVITSLLPVLVVHLSVDLYQSEPCKKTD